MEGSLATSHLTTAAAAEEEESGQWAVLVKKIKLIPRIPCIVGSEINYSIYVGRNGGG